jgi:hypothetical protein
MATCEDCIHCKDVVDGKGKCKYEHPETHFTLAGNKEIRRDNGWPIVDITEEGCGRCATE